MLGEGREGDPHPGIRLLFTVSIRVIISTAECEGRGWRESPHLQMHRLLFSSHLPFTSLVWGIIFMTFTHSSLTSPVVFGKNNSPLTFTNHFSSPSTFSMQVHISLTHFINYSPSVVSQVASLSPEISLFS